MNIYVDIETAPGDVHDPPDSVLAKGCGTLKDPAKIEAKREGNRAGWYEKAALDWRTGQVVGIGIISGDELRTVIQRIDMKEQELLGWFWTLVSGGDRFTPVVGFNIRQFDLPYLIGRAAVHGIAPDRKFNLARFRTDLGVIDWLEVLSFWGTFDLTGWTLDNYAKVFALPTQPVGDGKEVPSRWASGDYQYVIDHLAADMGMLKDLHTKFAGTFL